MRQTITPITPRKVPPGWEAIRFTEAFADRTGGQKKIKKSEYLLAGAVPVIDQGQEPIGGYTDDQSARCNVSLPCLLFGDHTKIIKYCDSPFALGADGVKVLEPRSDIDPRFAFYYISVLPLPTDAGYSRHFKFLKRTWFPLPPLPEQRRIAAILDKADAVRRKRQQTLDLADQFLRSAFLDMFGDPVTNPKGWPIKKLEDCISEKPRIGTIAKGMDDGSVTVVRVGDLGQLILPESLPTRVNLDQANINRFRIAPGDFLLARAIGSKEHLGKASIVYDGKLEPHEVRVFDSHVMRLKFDQAAMQPVFFWQWMKTPGGRALFMRNAERTAVQFNINATQIARIEVPVPPKELQMQFVNITSVVQRLVNMAGEATCRSTVFLNALVQRAFRGELLHE